MIPEFESLPDEVWKKVANYSYYISNYGRVFKIEFPDIVYNNERNNRICLCNSKSQNMLKTINVMYKAFFGNIPSGYIVKCKNDIHIDNLYLVKKAKRPKINTNIESLPGEIWKDIPDFPNYKISNMGRVLSLGSKTFPPHIMHLNNHDNKSLTLSNNGIKKAFCVNTLVTEIFHNHKINSCEFIEMNNGEPIVHKRNEIHHDYNLSDHLYTKSKYYKNKITVRNFEQGKYNNERVKCLSVHPYEYECKSCGKKLYPKRPIKYCKYCREKEIGLIRERNRKINTIRHKIYHAVQRCYNPNMGKAYETYGAKGITVIKYWKTYSNFVDWCLSECNGDIDKVLSLSIDRIDPRFEYAPYNCQLITKEENSRKMIYDNRRPKIILILDELSYKLRKRNWLKHMKSLGYKESDLI